MITSVTTPLPALQELRRIRSLLETAGEEFGVRGYVTAYDADTGEQAWRFFTVPGDPAKPFEHPEMKQAAETWKGGEWWKIGGGGTVWNSIVYDPDFHTVYLGVGNGSPWTRIIRSPGGGTIYFSQRSSPSTRTTEK